MAKGRVIPAGECSILEEAAEAFKKEVLLRHGCPITVTTDGGSHFKGEFEKLLENNCIAIVLLPCQAVLVFLLLC